ncbi:MAG: HIT family protein [Gordonia sp. (in: high G+C Gram-positive bacteria)]|uniref:HIT family protein n=1 Tax=Gordonia sp. (in: high G+C Gram-positive bacteria) TaxID=84139 RepID=UPI0039E4DD49
MSDCIFCDIVAGTAPSRQVYADDDVIAFLDIRPVKPGHTLVIPRNHSRGLRDLAPADGEKMFAVGQKVAIAMRTALDVDGVNLVVNDGRAAMQTVFHTHLHVIPRHRGDKLSFAKSLVVRRDPHPDATAAKLRRALDQS